MAITAATRRELTDAVMERYQAASAGERSRILDEFVALTGFHRKHAIRVLNTKEDTPKTSTAIARARPRLYDEAVRQAVVVLWEASDRVCGKRLRPLIPILVAALEKHGHMKLDDAVRSRVLTASASTLDRVLREPRAAASGRKRRRRPAAGGVRQSVPIRTFADWKEPVPGFLEVDLVAHCGESAAGSFANTLVLTDIASGWTECVALIVRESSLVVDALERLRGTMPFPLRGIDTDNGSEFVNEVLLTYCTEHKIEFTRSRPYRKNDQAWVEQKNGAIVRRMVGYGRLEGIAAGHALARLYSASRLFVNFFQPSFKLAEKKRTGARVSKRYHAPETPAARLLSNAAIEPTMRERLKAVLATLDPLRLLDEIRTVQHHLAALAAGDTTRALPHRDVDLEVFLKSLGVAWRAGEVRPTHRAPEKPARHWRTRVDPFETAWPRIVTWLETEPDRTAKELLERLHAEAPDAFGQKHLRTLQRRMKEWRRTMARRLVFTGPTLELS